MSDFFAAEIKHALTFLEGAQNNLDAVEKSLKRVKTYIAGDVDVFQTEAEYREEAVRNVLNAVVDSIRWHGLDRKRFKALITAEGRRTPSDGPASVKHEVLLAEARKVLGGKSTGLKVEK